MGFACAAVYHVCPARFRWVALLAVSYGFYASRSLLGLPFILTTTLTTWARRARHREDWGSEPRASVRGEGLAFAR